MENEVQNRLGILRDVPLSEAIVQRLIKVLSENPYAQFFRQLEDSLLSTYEICI